MFENKYKILCLTILQQKKTNHNWVKMNVYINNAALNLLNNV